MSLWQQFRECLRMALDPAYWCTRIDAWIMGNHLPPYDWVLLRNVEPWVPCGACRREWPCEHFLRAEERQRQRSAG